MFGIGLFYEIAEKLGKYIKQSFPGRSIQVTFLIE